LEALRSEVAWASSFFDRGRDQLGRLYIYNKLRVVFCVQCLEDIPRQHYEEALNLVRQAKDVLCEFRKLTREADRLFVENVVKSGDPWTPSLQAKWRKKLAESLPDRPDWRELAKELEGRS
jgi:hypothetical protein